MTTWFPIGPDFVFTPRDPSFKRLSRRNELARQGLVNSVAIDPNDASTIYTAETPTSGGTAAFRTDDGGSSWTSLVDSLQQADPVNVNLSCVAHHPSVSGVVYLGTFSGRVYTSTTRGSTWSAPFTTGSNVFKIIVDPRNATDPTTTVVYAACGNGVWRSIDGGTTFTQVLSSNLTAFAARIPTDGSTADFYAGVSGQGIFYTPDPTGTWTNLNTAAGTSLLAQVAGTPAQPNGNFDAIGIDVCRANRRVYAWFFNTLCDTSGANCNESNATPNTLFTTANPTGAWSTIVMTSPPGPSYGLYDSGFCVAANSPGDGNTDILFFGGIHLYRSTDSGRTWLDTNTDEVHDDYHAFAFFPDPPSAGVVPAMYIGCDGGLAVSTGFADPTFTPPGDFDTSSTYVNSGAVQNLNHGKQSTAVYGYGSDAAIAALGYVGVQDTGMNAGDSSLLWRGLANADGGVVACKPGSDGVKVWYTIDGDLAMITDHGDFSPGWAGVTFGAGGPGVNGTSNFEGSPDGTCVGGINPQISTTVASAITGGTQTVTPATMAFIAVGRVLTIDPNGTTQETVTVTAVMATTFTAIFGQAHPAGVSIRVEIRQFARVDQNAVATVFGPDFGLTPVSFAAVSPVDANLVCFTTADQRLFLCTNALAASPAFNQITSGQPTGSISSITIDPVGNIYVMLSGSVTSGSGEFSTTGPLFFVTMSGWVQCNCISLPSDEPGGTGYTRVVADPVEPNTLYAGHDARVFHLASTSAGGTFTWSDISTGLPGQWIYDLWIGNIGVADSPKVLLRAAVPCRGIWEVDVTSGATAPLRSLYMRDNVLDLGWLPSSPDGVPNPYNPSDTLYHYVCADIKVDAQQVGSAGAFFQTDPEGTLPLSHVLFDQLRDNSDNLPSANQAMVHVQVRNRSATPLSNVRVWAIYSNAGAGLPSLSKSPSNGNNYQFWSQFQVTGQIIPTLPLDSPWHSIGTPIVLNPVDAAHPQVASWQWTVPTLASGDPGHYCIVAFVHHSASPVNGSSFDVDEITPSNKQVGQKNLHIGPPLPSGGRGTPGGGGGGTPGGGRSGRPVMREHIVFNNPTGTARQATFLIQAKTLPPELRLSFMLTKIQTVQPLASSITGVVSTTGEHLHGHHHHHHHDLDEHLLYFLDRIEDEIEEALEELTEWVGHWDKDKVPHGGVPQLPVYTGLPSTNVTVTGVLLPPFGAAGMVFTIENRGSLPTGSHYTFHVQQVVAGKVVGGSAYVVRIEGNRPPVVIPEIGEEDLGWVPSYATAQIAVREGSLGKR